MKTSILFLQKAIFNALLNNQKLINKVTGIYDSVEDDTPFPYVYIGEDDSKKISTKDMFIEEVITPIEIFSEYKGKREVKEIMQLVLDSLTNLERLERGFIITKKDIITLDVEDNIDFKIGKIDIKFIIEEE